MIKEVNGRAETHGRKNSAQEITPQASLHREEAPFAHE